jgi:hypothetical protein
MSIYFRCPFILEGSSWEKSEESIAILTFETMVLNLRVLTFSFDHLCVSLLNPPPSPPTAGERTLAIDHAFSRSGETRSGRLAGQ